MVELTASQAYGLVHMSTLTDDYYRMNDSGTALRGSRTGKLFTAGSKIEVIVDRVDRFKRQVDFRLYNPKSGAAKPNRDQQSRPRDNRKRF
jgi:ribonuclease R